MTAKRSTLWRPWELSTIPLAILIQCQTLEPLAQERGINSQKPLQTELLASLDAGHLHLDSPALAKVQVDWNGPDCKLRAGSTVVGHIAEIKPHSSQSKGSSITVVFDKADCNGHPSTPVSLVLFAVIAQVTIPEETMQDRNTNFGIVSEHPHMTNGSSSKSGPQPTYVPPEQDMSLRAHSQKADAPNMVLPGQVVGLSKVTLSVGTGAEGGSVLTSPNHNIRVERTTALVLMPSASLKQVGKLVSTPAAATHTAEESPHETHEAIAMPLPPPEPIDETEICSSSCSTVPDKFASPDRTPGAIANLSAANLGYVPHDRREFTGFNYESTLTYLDASNVLFTFDPHQLRRRTGNDARPESTHIVRAILVDTSNQTIKRIVDWSVQGDGQYLWRAGSGRVLVHIGHQLRLIDPDLNSVRMVDVPGVLAWVSSSPTGSNFAVGVLHERHTPALHQLILDSSNIDPEEDIDVRVFDHDLSLLLTTTQPSTMYPPVLSDSGEILIHADGHHRWKISEYRWDRTDHPIATTNSRCHPTISTPLPNYLFMVGCTDTPALNWYRLLRLDGHTVLKSRGSSQEIEQAADSAADQEFAIRVVHTFKSLFPGNSFHKDDLKEQEISVYDTANGRRLFTATANDMPPTEQTFALSPSGRQIVVLRDNSIDFYSFANPAP